MELCRWAVAYTPFSEEEQKLRLLAGLTSWSYVGVYNKYHHATRAHKKLVAQSTHGIYVVQPLRETIVVPFTLLQDRD